MSGQIMSLMVQIATACVGWFDQILTLTGTYDIYLGMVFVAMLTGFLLSHFGSGFRMGSDTVANMASKSDKAKGGKKN